MSSLQFSGTRRDFLKAGTVALAGVPFIARAADAEKPGKLFSAMGVIGTLARAEKLKAAGAEFLTESTADFLVPDQADAVFAAHLEKLAVSPLPVLACNGFIRPKNLRCVGPEANHDAILEWADVSFRRLKQAKGKFIVFGSGGSRELRDGWPKEKADEQFVQLLKRMGPLAENHGVTVTVEQLQASECNYINHIGELAALIRKAGHPAVRALADLFHIARGGDTPDDLKAAMDVVVHVEIAEKEGRTYPGVKGDDFRPYFKVLRETGYKGAINMEAKGTDEQIAAAFKVIAKQAAEV